MPNEMAMQMSRRAEELAYVTAHFRDMQGMVYAPFLLAVDAVAMSARLLHWSWQCFYLFPLELLLGLAAGVAIRRWYRRQFGLVAGPRIQVQGPIQRIATAIVMALLLVAPRLPDSKNLNSLYPIPALLIFLLPRCLDRTPPIAKLQMRRMLSIAVMLLMLGLICAQFRAHASRIEEVNGMFFCFALIVTYDHWLLTSLLGGRRGREAFDAE